MWGSSSSSSYGTGSSSSSYSYSSYNYTPPSGQREQIWNSYGLRSWVRSDADTTKIETLKQACASVTSSAWDIWMSGAGDYNSVNFGMPDEAKCRSWTPNSSSSYSYSSYNPASSASSSSYSYSSYPTYPSCANEMISLLGTGCHFMYNDSSNTAVYCNSEMTKSAKLGDAAATNGCQSGMAVILHTVLIPLILQALTVRILTAVMTLQLLASNMEGHGTALIANIVHQVLIARPVQR